MKDIFTSIRENRAKGNPVGLYSVCSSHPIVLEAAIRRVALNRRPILIESTANQVNQNGGYTGMTPFDFVERLEKLIARYGVDKDLVIFGGDHLGPYPWRSEPAVIAMEKAEIMVRQYIAAGARKIHLDTSMALADDKNAVLPPELIAKRSAILCRAAEDEFSRINRIPNTHSIRPIYIIGTEVPVPGGEVASNGESSSEIVPTTSESFELTYDVHKNAFLGYGLEEAWERVMAVVVQPGVDFDSRTILPYNRKETVELRKALKKKDTLFFEAHSTDYQTTEALQSLVHDGFVFLKVGPALTFAYREALFGLTHIAKEIGLSGEIVEIENFVLKCMQENPKHWAPYYEESSRETLLFSLSDRIRYYWDLPEIQVKIDALLAAISDKVFPIGLVAQYLPKLGGPEHIAQRNLQLDPQTLLFESIDAELLRYEVAVEGEKGIANE